MQIERHYKNFIIVKNGTTEYPYNIYLTYDNKRAEIVGYDRTLKNCKVSIDNGLFDDEAAKYTEFRNKLKSSKSEL